MTVVKDRIGERNGRIVITSRSDNDSNGGAMWNYKCDCGSTGRVSGSAGKFSLKKSCGCIMREVISRRVNSPLTQSKLKDQLNYNPETGIFTWVSIKQKVHIGMIAGGYTDKGYILINIFGRKYAAHRLAWLYVYGEFPPDLIDHINGIKDDNRICNLRKATPAENNQNIRKAFKSNKSSGLLGVSWLEYKKKWHSRIVINGKQKSLGFYKTPMEAHEAYIDRKSVV